MIPRWEPKKKFHNCPLREDSGPSADKLNFIFTQKIIKFFFLSERICKYILRVAYDKYFSFVILFFNDQKWPLRNCPQRMQFLFRSFLNEKYGPTKTSDIPLTKKSINIYSSPYIAILVGQELYYLFDVDCMHHKFDFMYIQS